MALPLRPDVSVNNDHTSYSSLDATDQALFDGLTVRNDRRKFCEMIYRWREAIQEDRIYITSRCQTQYANLFAAETAPLDGQAIADRWRISGRKLSKLRKMATVAAQAIPPLAAPVGQPANAQGGLPANVQPDQPTTPQTGQTVTTLAQTAPIQSPLAELSPWFVCQSDEDKELAPTKGQADFIAADLDAPWKFADVIFQKEPTMVKGMAPFAPTTSVHLFVRPNQDGIIEEVCCKSK